MDLGTLWLEGRDLTNCTNHSRNHIPQALHYNSHLLRGRASSLFRRLAESFFSGVSDSVSGDTGLTGFSISIFSGDLVGGFLCCFGGEMASRSLLSLIALMAILASLGCSVRDFALIRLLESFDFLSSP